MCCLHEATELQKKPLAVRGVVVASKQQAQHTTPQGTERSPSYSDSKQQESLSQQLRVALTPNVTVTRSLAGDAVVETH